jgi:membrane protein
MSSSGPFWKAFALILVIAAAFSRRGDYRDQKRLPANWPGRVQSDRARSATGAFGATRSVDEPPQVQHERAHDQGRGREATSPWQIPWAGWKDVFWRTYQGINDNRILAVAAGVVFYGLLAIFPAITALVSLYGLFADPSTVNDQLSMANGILPSGATDIIRDQVTRLTSNGGTKLGFGFIVGFLIALWSANTGMKAIMDALNVVYDEKEKRGFIKLNLVSLIFTLGGIVSVLLAIGTVVILPVVLNFVGLGSVTDLLLRIVRWPILLALVIVGLGIMYRYAPSRREPRWRWISVGSIISALVWLVISLLFSWYVANFGNYNATYGSLGAAIGMMTWMWISIIIILVGALLNAEIEHQTAKDSTEETPKPLGARGAVMADTVGAAQS